MFKADLHCHTSCSDGSCSPEEVIALAQTKGLQGLSITDHDTIQAYAVAINAAKQAGIRLGTGVEFSSEHVGISVHILGYDFRLDSAEILGLCQRHQNRRQERNRLILEKLKSHGMPIEEKELLEAAQNRTVGRPHIAQLMVQKGYVGSIKEAFYRYLGEGKLCYAPGEKFTSEETIEVLHAGGGKAFLAHPHLMPANLSEILKLPFDGIECYYAKLFPDRWLKVAKKRGWLVSGGSDFHGSIKPENPLGCSTVDLQIFEQIFEHEL